MRDLFGELPESLGFWHPASLIATWFGAGLLPIGPGTWGSAAALPFGFALMWWGGVWALASAIVVVSVLGWWASARFVAALNAEDPPEIVVDEVVAQWLVLLATPLTWWGYFVAFALFRIFDTSKVWPANWIDAHMEGANGVMLDDLTAGVYAMAVMAALVWMGVV
jgi:phosphatidylglycerophosphatase A